MIKVSVNGKEKRLPSNWRDIGLSQYDKIMEVADNQIKLISVITGLSESEVSRLSAESANLLTAILKFLETPFKLNEYDNPKEIRINGLTINPLFDIKEKSLYQKMQLQTLLEEKDFNIDKNISTILELYLQPLCTSKKYSTLETEHVKKLIYESIGIVDAHLLAAYYIGQLGEILETEKNTLDRKPTGEQRRAGIERFNKYGMFNIVDALAKGDVLKWEQVLELDYNTVYLKLLKEKDESIFQEAYTKIMQTKK